MGYTPEPLILAEEGDPIRALGRYVANELQRVGDAFVTEMDFIHLSTLAVEPAKPREGMVVRADGVNFDPGSGAGIYAWRAGSWRFLG